MIKIAWLRDRAQASPEREGKKDFIFFVDCSFKVNEQAN